MYILCVGVLCSLVSELRKLSCTCICLYVCMYVQHICLCVCACIHIIYIYIYMYICIYIYIYIYIYEYLQLCEPGYFGEERQGNGGKRVVGQDTAHVCVLCVRKICVCTYMCT